MTLPLYTLSCFIIMLTSPCLKNSIIRTGRGSRIILVWRQQYLDMIRINGMKARSSQSSKKRFMNWHTKSARHPLSFGLIRTLRRHTRRTFLERTLPTRLAEIRTMYVIGMLLNSPLPKSLVIVCHPSNLLCSYVVYSPPPFSIPLGASYRISRELRRLCSDMTKTSGTIVLKTACPYSKGDSISWATKKGRQSASCFWKGIFIR